MVHPPPSPLASLAPAVPLAAGTTIQAGVIACLPTLLGYWGIGFAAGGIGTLCGFSPGEVLALAALLYAGSAQFLFYSLTLTQAGDAAVISGVLMVNARYLLMSAALAPFFRGKGWMEKLMAGALLTDETFGIAIQRAKAEGSLPFAWLLGLNLSAYVNWIVANAVGALMAHHLPEPLLHSLGFSLTAMFVGLVLLTVLSSRTRWLELVAIGVTAGVMIGLFPLSTSPLGVLAAAIAGALVSTLLSLRRLPWRRSWSRPSF